jgi:hypothetical protein
VFRHHRPNHFFYKPIGGARQGFEILDYSKDLPAPTTPHKCWQTTGRGQREWIEREGVDDLFVLFLPADPFSLRKREIRAIGLNRDPPKKPRHCIPANCRRLFNRIQ